MLSQRSWSKGKMPSGLVNLTSLEPGAVSSILLATTILSAGAVMAQTPAPETQDVAETAKVEKRRMPKRFDREHHERMAKKLAKKRHLIFVCGHYEGIDARIYPEVDLEVSLGDFILTGGELAACVMIDAITRLQPGTFKKEDVTSSESFEGNLLEAPQYTRPEVWRGRRVPAVLLNGNHKEIEAWKREQSLALTKQLRPDLLENASQKPKKVQKKKTIRRK